MNRKLLVTILAMNCMVLGSAKTIAFEGFEHQQIGDIAFALAVDIYCQSEACTDANVKTSLDAIKEAMPKLHALSYGDIIRCVDVMMTPEYLFALSMEKIAKNRKDKKPADTGFVDDWANLGYEKHDCQVRDVFSTRRQGQLFRATHNNHAHFQAHLLTSLQLYHTLAKSLAGTGRLPAALVANAIGDHYLHDFFAPGHMATRRAEMTDLFATQMHDYFNNEGKKFKVSWEKTDGNVFVVVAEEVVKLLETNYHDKDRCNQKCNDIREMLLFKPASIKREDLKPRTMSDLEDVLDKLLRTLTSNSEFRMYGDDLLWREWNGCMKTPPEAISDGCEKEVKGALAQRLLMVIANVTSIVEVLCEYRSPKVRDVKSDPKFCKENSDRDLAFGIASASWPGKADFSIADDNMVYAGLSFGHYTDGRPAPNKANATQVQNSAMNNSDLSYDTANQNPWKNPPLMISFSRESMTSNDVGRWAYGLEYLQLLTIRNYPGWTQNPFVGLGIVGNREGRRYAQGMSARAGVLFPEIEGTMSVFVRRQAHKSANASVLQNGYGFRVDMGFSSMLSAFLGGGIDFGFDSSDQPQRGKFFFGGLSLSFPQSQVLRLLP